MMIQKNFYVDTSPEIDVINVFHEVDSVIKESKVCQGLVTLMAPLEMASFVILDSRKDADKKFKEELTDFLKESEKIRVDSPASAPVKKRGIGRLHSLETLQILSGPKISKEMLMFFMGRTLTLRFLRERWRWILGIMFICSMLALKEDGGSFLFRSLEKRRTRIRDVCP